MEQNQLPRFFIDQYNIDRGTEYKFHRFRKSTFNSPKYQYPAFEIYQLLFIEGKNRALMMADLLAALNVISRLLTEVVRPKTRPENVSRFDWAQLAENVIDPIERDALNGIACAQTLIIDGRPFGPIKIENVKAYKNKRVERDKMLEADHAINKKLGLKKHNKRIYQELNQVGIPVGHWFKEIWMIFQSKKKGKPMCLQIW